jgi:hypothetical protein
MSSGIPSRTAGAVSSDIARLQLDNDLHERTAAMLANGRAFERSSEIRARIHL